MKTISHFAAALVAVAVSSSLALAQNNSSPAPAPVVAVNSSDTPTFDHVIYLAKLPTPAELIQGADAQHAKIDRMDQSSDRIVAVYSYANGRTVAFAYTLMSAIGTQPNVTLTTGAGPGPATGGASPVVYASPAPAPTVVYTSSPDTVYYAPGYVRYYEPVWDFWAPLALGIGLGWGWHGGGWHGGWHGGGWHGGGGGHGWHH